MVILGVFQSYRPSGTTPKYGHQKFEFSEIAQNHDYEVQAQVMEGVLGWEIS